VNPFETINSRKHMDDACGVDVVVLASPTGQRDERRGALTLAQGREGIRTKSALTDLRRLCYCA